MKDAKGLVRPKKKKFIKGFWWAMPFNGLGIFNFFNGNPFNAIYFTLAAIFVLMLFNLEKEK